MNTSLRVLGLVLLALGATGCAAGGGWAASALVLFALATLGISGCTTSHGTDADATVVVDEDADVGPDAGGSWEACCVDGHVDSCFCPAGVACNYGWFDHCADGTCSELGGCRDAGTDAGVDAGVDAGIDAGAADAGGSWDPCCVDGVITTCFCPADLECNYGWYEDCGEGTCTDPGSTCPMAGDAGVDAGEDGYWEPCCQDGVITTCFCPAGIACNYGWYEDCGGGTCTFPGDACP